MMFDKKGVYFLPLGGADEIGLNLYVYACDGKFIIVDVGYTFLNDDYPGMDLGLADASFLEKYKNDIEGLFISHAHEDHFGAIAHIWPKLECPVYATDFALGLIKERLKESKLDSTVPLISATENKHIELKNFSVDFVSVVHSVPETSALIIKTKYANIVHATDWRFDDEEIAILQTDFKSLEDVSKEGVDLFVCDSTNVLVDENFVSEKDVRNNLMKLIPSLQNGVIATCFATNLMRLESLILAAHEAGRTPVLVGRSLEQNMRIAKEVGYFTHLPLYLSLNDARDIPSDKILYICTGSQGNYRSALTLIVKGEKRDIKLHKGDTVIFSSSIVPGNEDKIEAMHDKLIAQGVDVITRDDSLVHTTGHASRKELKRMYEILKPKIIIPVHGEKRFIKEHKKFALSLGVKEVVIAKNGDVLLINNGTTKFMGEIPTDVLGVDRKRVVSLNSQLIKNRRRLMFNCSVYIGAVFDNEWKLKDLQIKSIDILEENEFNYLADEIISKIKEEIDEQVIKLNRKESAVEEYIRGKVRKFIENKTDIKPVTFVHFYKG